MAQALLQQGKQGRQDVLRSIHIRQGVETRCGALPHIPLIVVIGIITAFVVGFVATPLGRAAVKNRCHILHSIGSVGFVQRIGIHQLLSLLLRVDHALEQDWHEARKHLLDIPVHIWAADVLLQ